MSVKGGKMIVYGVLVAVLLQCNTEAFPYDFPSKSTGKLKNQDKKLSPPPKPSLRDILGGIGTKPIFEESIYDETDPIKLCFADIEYVNETNGAASSWQEYHVSIYSPADDSKLTPSKTLPKYREYGVEMPNGTVINRKYEVIEINKGYVISKRENLTCGEGQFLRKSSEEWQQKKKILIRLSDKAFLETANRSKVAKEDDVSEEVLQMPRPDAYTKLFKSEEEKVTKSPGSETVITVAPLTQPDVTTLSSGNQNNNTVFLSPNNGKKNSKKFVELTKVNFTTSEEEVVPKINACSPLLTQLFSGHMILPGLCNMTKNDKIILQGDIFVSLKHSNDETKPKPLFVIHENTEIESTLEKVEETTKKILNLNVD